ncbi:type II toxin-antitoxin system RelE/ParE family toxin [Galbitalea sp. SE-J8]|uniref:type II toxin-antitoxin system RelE/ParE family toxin n=1 Tax=Galbitalea sp. SE-J8 TaxID=3054952 RepID=UPI00259CF6F9|nr:type II toxin-antitoxin system RelE/ParE family toxin [Galbitalea sp. SE-J8]MDM4764326.1 type II toxin-antitoxin system RelE/ParE family toxin [Galbitalea sp. SE-J8]
MSYSVLFRYNAEHDAERTQDWYALHAPEQVDRFTDDLAATVRSIRESPYAFRVLRRDARRAALTTFPYLVWYRIHDEGQVIEVLAVVHERQDDERLQSRLE